MYEPARGTVHSFPYDPRTYEGLINVNTGVWHISSWTGGQQLDWTAADAAKVTNLMTIAPQTTKKVNLSGVWSSNNGQIPVISDSLTTPSLEDVEGDLG